MKILILGRLPSTKNEEDLYNSIINICNKHGNVFDSPIDTKNFNGSDEERYKKAFSLAKENGCDALLIRGADLLDNSKYYYLVKSKDLKKLLLWKYDYFLKISEELIGNTQVFKDFKTYRQNLV